MRPPACSECQALEREAHDAIRRLRVTLDDLAATLERLRQVRQAAGADAPGPAHLVIEVGPNGRPEVCR